MATPHFRERTACPVCGDPGFATLYQCGMAEDPVRAFIASHYRQQGEVDWAALADAKYQLCRCHRCALLFQKTVPDGEMLMTLYGTMISASFTAGLERRRLTLDNFARIAGELTYLFRRLGKHPADISFLDFGFGHGRWARVARALGARVVATEIGDDKRRAAAAIGVEIVDDSALDAMRFDIVHTEQVFEHLVHPGRDFARLAAITTGLLKIAVPRHGDIPALLRRHGMADRSPIDRVLAGRPISRPEQSYIAIQPLEHINTFSDTTMRHLAAANHLRIVGTVRRQAITSPAALARQLLKRLSIRRGGYYLFAPETPRS